MPWFRRGMACHARQTTLARIAILATAPRRYVVDDWSAPHRARISCYGTFARGRSRWMGNIAASICTGHGMPCPYKTISRGRPTWNCRVPIHGAGMLEAPVHRDPARPPRLASESLRRARRGARNRRCRNIGRRRRSNRRRETPGANATAARAAFSDNARRRRRSDCRRRARE